MKEKILRRQAVMEMLGISSATLHRRIKDGSVPAPLRLGPNSVGWKESNILAVIAGYEEAFPVPVAPGSRKGSQPRQVGG